jgi:hypothetical protein
MSFTIYEVFGQPGVPLSEVNLTQLLQDFDSKRAVLRAGGIMEVHAPIRAVNRTIAGYLDRLQSEEPQGLIEIYDITHLRYLDEAGVIKLSEPHRGKAGNEHSVDYGIQKGARYADTRVVGVQKPTLIRNRFFPVRG